MSPAPRGLRGLGRLEYGRGVNTPKIATDTLEAELLTRLTVERMLEGLSEEEREIVHLWLVEELTFDEIGAVIGEKYRGRPLSGSAIRYHRDRIIERLRRENETD